MIKLAQTWLKLYRRENVYKNVKFDPDVMVQNQDLIDRENCGKLWT